MNRQEIFSTVVTNLYAQAGPSIDDGVCAYRSPTGRKCAAGFLIPDDKYEPRMEGQNAEASQVAGAIYPQLDDADDIALVLSCQLAHDEAAMSRNDETQEWKELDGDEFLTKLTPLLHTIAANYNVEFPEGFPHAQ